MIAIMIMVLISHKRKKNKLDVQWNLSREGIIETEIVPRRECLWLGRYTVLCCYLYIQLVLFFCDCRLTI